MGKGTITSWPASGSACSAPIAANNFTSTNVYLRGLHGDQDTELNGSGGLIHTNVFVEGGVTATYWDSSQYGWEWSYEFSDWQGTKRVQANALGAENLWQSDPYNDYMTPIVAGQDATEHHYTQKERDVESGNDYFGARYYTSLMGRFMSPDWSAKVEPVPYAKAGDPQSLNLYAFVGNNPLSHVDVDGHDGVTNGLAMEAQYAEGNSNWAAYSGALEQAAANRYAAAHENSAAEKAQKQNSTQKWEAQNEKKVQANIASLPKAPAGARMVLTDCAAKLCNYSLTGVSGTFYAYEHFANAGVSPAIQIGPNDYTTDKTGTAGGFREDQITAFGLGQLDQHRYFTISSSSTYDPSKQMSVIISEGGHDYAYEHLYNEAANAPSYINGIMTDSYHQ